MRHLKGKSNGVSRSSRRRMWECVLDIKSSWSVVSGITQWFVWRERERDSLDLFEEPQEQQLLILSDGILTWVVVNSGYLEFIEAIHEDRRRKGVWLETSTTWVMICIPKGKNTLRRYEEVLKNSWNKGKFFFNWKLTCKRRKEIQSVYSPPVGIAIHLVRLRERERDKRGNHR